MKSREQRIEEYVQQALTLNDDVDGAVLWLAVFVANDAASSALDRPRAELVEAFRRASAIADAAAEATR